MTVCPAFPIHHSMLDVRPARNALRLVRDKFNNLIHNSMISLTQRTMHGRRVFIVFSVINPVWRKPQISRHRDPHYP